MSFNQINIIAGVVIGGFMALIGASIIVAMRRGVAKLLSLPRVEARIVDHRAYELQDSEGVTVHIAAAVVRYTFDGQSYDYNVSPRAVTRQYGTPRGAEKALPDSRAEYPVGTRLALHIDPTTLDAPQAEAQVNASGLVRGIGLALGSPPPPRF
ncbi:MAG: hypothetical protein SGI73_18990 [Chloroflexota bacterium]|nr:hypothetical protein [Chloroflexota bacterium]